MNCKTNELKTIINAYSKEIFNLKEENEKLKEENEKLKKYRSSQDHKFMEYYNFYVKERKKYDKIIKWVKINQQVLDKYNY